MEEARNILSVYGHEALTVGYTNNCLANIDWGIFPLYLEDQANQEYLCCLREEMILFLKNNH